MAVVDRNAFRLAYERLDRGQDGEIALHCTDKLDISLAPLPGDVPERAPEELCEEHAQRDRERDRDGERRIE